MKMIIGNRKMSFVTKIGVYSLLLTSGLELDLNNCCYSSDTARNIISFLGLYRQGFRFSLTEHVWLISTLIM